MKYKDEYAVKVEGFEKMLWTASCSEGAGISRSEGEKYSD